ncbi:MAG: ATP-binding protein [Desulfuromonadales bacterium]|nr:ATP-binding protein [Desulfuromonadales bacterium]
MEIDIEFSEQLKRLLNKVERLLPKLPEAIDWGKCLTARWRSHSFRGYLEPVKNRGGLLLKDLLGIERQKKVIDENTRQFLNGFPANNILLWGTRGSGKSSLIRALLNEYADKGLRVIQVDKDDLVSLPEIFDEIREKPYRYLIFADDVSFETGESSYKMLKSVLDGSVFSPSDNVLIYITSNRRHLLPEYETDNMGVVMVNNELHHGDTVEEKISLSSRFGICIGFHPFTLEQYIEVARLWTERVAEENNVNLIWSEDAEKEALDWAHIKGERSGRVAWQFAQQYVGKMMLDNMESKIA